MVQSNLEFGEKEERERENLTLELFGTRHILLSVPNTFVLRRIITHEHNPRFFRYLRL